LDSSIADDGFCGKENLSGDEPSFAQLPTLTDYPTGCAEPREIHRAFRQRKRKWQSL